MFNHFHLWYGNPHTILKGPNITYDGVSSGNLKNNTGFKDVQEV